jgi:hypothetical protein
MKRGAKAYFTVFILDHESRGQIEANLTLFRFQYRYQGAYAEAPDELDLAVAYDRSVFETMVVDAGLEVVAFYPAHWRKLPYEDGQDAYVLAKP